MKRKDLKELIKECVREVVFEEGVLSELIAEVAFGITQAQTLLSETSKAASTPSPEIDDRKLEKERQKKLNETKMKMLDAIGNDSMKGIFENTTPLNTVGVPNQVSAPGSPLAGRSPTDSGVNIDGLLGTFGQAWIKLK